jgi:tRNA dimethylallyltransferase
MNQFKFISIVGQTATGKTAKAFALAELWTNKYHQPVVVISADSKQVYQELTILSGADIPNSFVKKSNSDLTYHFFAHPTLPITLHGTSIINSHEEWSVGHFHHLVKELTNFYPQALFIMVGGTGLYHQQIYNPAETLHIKPNEQLRESLAEKNIGELQAILNNKNTNKLEEMNNSDKNNPRRLVRAIEVADAVITPSHYEKIEPLIQIGLATDNVEEKIQQRVLKRLDQDVVNEIKALETKLENKASLAKSTLGYKEVLQFINQEIDQEKLVELWTLAEVQYAKRQMTWWKKQENITWTNTQKINLKLILDIL